MFFVHDLMQTSGGKNYSAEGSCRISVFQNWSPAGIFPISILCIDYCGKLLYSSWLHSNIIQSHEWAYKITTARCLTLYIKIYSLRSKLLSRCIVKTIYLEKLEKSKWLIILNKGSSDKSIKLTHTSHFHAPGEKPIALIFLFKKTIART